MKFTFRFTYRMLLLQRVRRQDRSINHEKLNFSPHLTTRTCTLTSDTTPVTITQRMDPSWIEEDRAAWISFQQEQDSARSRSRSSSCHGTSKTTSAGMASMRPGATYVQTDVNFAVPMDVDSNHQHLRVNPLHLFDEKKISALELGYDEVLRNAHHPTRSYGYENVKHQGQNQAEVFMDPTICYNTKISKKMNILQNSSAHIAIESDASSYCDIYCNDCDSNVSDISDDPLDKFSRHAFPYEQLMSKSDHPISRVQGGNAQLVPKRVKCIVKDKATTIEAIQAGDTVDIKCPVCHLSMKVVSIAKFVLCERCQTVFKR